MELLMFIDIREKHDGALVKLLPVADKAKAKYKEWMQDILAGSEKKLAKVSSKEWHWTAPRKKIKTGRQKRNCSSSRIFSLIKQS